MVSLDRNRSQAARDKEIFDFSFVGSVDVAGKESGRRLALCMFPLRPNRDRREYLDILKSEMVSNFILRIPR